MISYDTPPGFTLLYRPLKHLQAINRIAWSPDGRMLAAPSNSQAIGLWDTKIGQRLRTLAGHTGFVYSVAWSPDGSILASSSSDRTIRLWDAQSGQCKRTLLEHSEPVYSVAWSPVESVLVSGASDGIILWDVQEGKPLRIFTQQPASVTSTASQVYSVIWSPNGAVLASGSADCTIRLWESSSGRQIRILEGYTGVVTSLSFSRDSRLLASKSREGSASFRLIDD